MTKTVDTPHTVEASGLDNRLLVLSPEDNIVVARLALHPGDVVQLEAGQAELTADVPAGFKLARHAIAAGDKIIKYGAPIGSATTSIAPGALVHVHNMKSDYLPTYTQTDESRFTTRRTG